MPETAPHYLPFSSFRDVPEERYPCEKVLLGDFFRIHLPEDVFGQLKKTIAPDNSFTQRTYDAQGNVKTTVDEAGRSTSFEYDHENRVTRTTFTDESFTEVEYDAVGRRTASIDRNGNRTEYGYDEAGNNTVVRDALGNETTYEYDEVNRRVAMVDALDQRTEYVYDDYDRLVRTDYHDGTYATIEYDVAGRKVAEVDQAGKRTEFTYDSTGNLRTVKDALQHVTEYTYDNNNNRITQTDANTHTTTMEYDILNRLTAREYPGGDRETYSYNANGNMVSKVDGEGDSTVYTYDGRNREVLRRYTNSGHTVRTVYTIDNKRDSVIDHRGVTTYEWGDCCGQLVRVNNPDGTYIRYEYDDNKNKTAMITPWSRTEYTYDSLNRMDSVIADGAVTRYFYNVVGNRDSIAHANGTGVKYTYDNLNRLTGVVNYGTDGSVISSYAYELNDAGIRTAVTEHNGSRVDYGYDDLYRLVSETRIGSDAYSIGYTYDNVGNRITKDHDGVMTNYTYNTRDQLESESNVNGVVAYTYDRDGRMATKVDGSGTTTYAWVDEDRMASVSTAAGAINYTYDADNARVAVDDGSTVKNYLIDTRQQYAQVVAEYGDPTAPTVEYVFGLERIAQDRGGSVVTFVSDGQGSIRQLTSVAGNVTDNYNYFAFGEELSSSGSTENEFRYVGEQFDPNAGFYYNRARWHSPGIGRFTSVDPWEGDLQSPVSLHRYLYANISPVSFKDPTGSMAVLAIKAQTQTAYSVATTVAYNTYAPMIIKAVAIGLAAYTVWTFRDEITQLSDELGLTPFAGATLITSMYQLYRDPKFQRKLKMNKQELTAEIMLPSGIYSEKRAVKDKFNTKLGPVRLKVVSGHKGGRLVQFRFGFLLTPIKLQFRADYWDRRSSAEGNFGVHCHFYCFGTSYTNFDDHLNCWNFNSQGK